jgi:nucleoside 2-deoxyribosyltransferase
MPKTKARPRVYLAGPEVFLPNAREVGTEKCRIAAEAGFKGVFPLDIALDLSGLTKVEQARRISLANESLMRSCDALIANLTPFRGVSMDAGTAFEVGFMRALGRPVAGYTNAVDHHLDRARAFRAGASLHFDADRPDVEIEDFDLAENLMIEIAIRESGCSVVRNRVGGGHEMTDLTGFRQCLAELQRLFPGQAP